MTVLTADLRRATGPRVGKLLETRYVGIVEYAGDPNGNLTPQHIGQLCRDTTNNDYYRAWGTVNTNWAPEARSDITAAELDVLDGLTATTAELNRSDIVTLGLAAASKGMFLDANGDLVMPATSRVMESVPVPETATDTATLTDAQMIGGILVGTPTAAAAYTMRTGTQLESALSSNIISGSYIDLVIINLGSTTGWSITLTASTGITTVGNAVVPVAADVGTLANNSGVFRLRRVSANVFVAYRIA